MMGLQMLSILLRNPFRLNFFQKCRLEPVIIELERQRAPVVVISHQVIFLASVLPYHIFYSKFYYKLLLALLLQAVLRALYAYFADRPLKEIPHIEVIRINFSFC